MTHTRFCTDAQKIRPSAPLLSRVVNSDRRRYLAAEIKILTFLIFNLLSNFSVAQELLVVPHLRKGVATDRAVMHHPLRISLLPGRILPGDDHSKLILVRQHGMNPQTGKGFNRYYRSKVSTVDLVDGSQNYLGKVNVAQIATQAQQRPHFQATAAIINSLLYRQERAIALSSTNGGQQILELLRRHILPHAPNLLTEVQAIISDTSDGEWSTPTIDWGDLRPSDLFKLFNRGKSNEQRAVLLFDDGSNDMVMLSRMMSEIMIYRPDLVIPIVALKRGHDAWIWTSTDPFFNLAEDGIPIIPIATVDSDAWMMGTGTNLNNFRSTGFFGGDWPGWWAVVGGDAVIFDDILGIEGINRRIERNLAIFGLNPKTHREKLAEWYGNEMEKNNVRNR